MDTFSFPDLLIKQKILFFFECGFRLCGGHLYNYFPLIGCYDNLDLFLVYQLTGSTDILSRNNVNNKDLTCLTLNVYAKAGTVKNIKGFDVREFYVQLVSDLKNRNL